MLTDSELKEATRFATDSRVIAIMAATYAKAEYEENAYVLTGAIAVRLLIASCKITEDPMGTLDGLIEIVKKELKEDSHADRQHQLEDKDEGLQRQAGSVQEGNGKELQTTPTT